MGSSCGLFNKQSNNISHPVPKPRYLPDCLPPDLRSSRIGPFIATESTPQKQEKWSSFMHEVSHYAEQSKKKKNTILQRVAQGPPLKYRWQTWLSILDLQSDSDQYISVPMADSQVMYEIDKDIERTHPDHPYLNTVSGRVALRRVLGKVAVAIKEIGYCQGMNRIAAFVLMVSGGSEVETYFFLVEICKKFSLQDFFEEEMSGIKKQIWIFNKILKTRMSKLYEHFEREMFTEDYWLFKWMMTLFTMGFNEEVTLRVWDNFLVHGKKFLLHFSLAILHKFETELLAMDMVELSEFFKCISQNITDYEELVKLAKKNNISSKLLNKLELLYENMHPDNKPKRNLRNTTKIDRSRVRIYMSDSFHLPSIHQKYSDRYSYAKSSDRNSTSRNKTLLKKRPTKEHLESMVSFVNKLPV